MNGGAREQHGGNVAAVDGTGESENKGHTQKEMEKEQQLSRYNENERLEMRHLKLGKRMKQKFIYVDSSV